MCIIKNVQDSTVRETEDLKGFVRNLDVDLVGVADVRLLQGMPLGLPLDPSRFFQTYRYGIVMGLPVGKLGKKVPGRQISLSLEKAAIEVVAYLEERGYRALTIHTEDEFDPINRLGFMSLKVLGKAAGLGWQGRSLLIVSPRCGPLHRLVAVLTNMHLKADSPIPNRCDGCTLCIDSCPTGALKWVAFEDHPERREDVLDIRACLGDDGCRVCLITCPWGNFSTGR